MMLPNWRGFRIGCRAKIEESKALGWVVFISGIGGNEEISPVFKRLNQAKSWVKERYLVGEWVMEPGGPCWANTDLKTTTLEYIISEAHPYPLPGDV